MNYLTIIVTLLIVFGLAIGCLALAGAAVPTDTAITPTPRPATTHAEAEAEARALEAQEAIERARAEQIRAEGEKVRAEASADVERALGESAARAIDRQGRLLTAYIVAGQGKLFGIGVLVGVALAVVGIAVSVEYGKVKAAAETDGGDE